MSGQTMAAIGPITAGQAAQCAGIVLFAAAAVQDIAFRKVGNAVPLAVAALGLAWRAAQGDLLPALGSAFLVFVAAAFCWRRGWLGGADAKLFGAGALLVPSGFTFVLATALAGGVLGCAYWLLGRVVAAPGTRDAAASRLRRFWRVERRRLRRGGPLPYAVALLAGIALAFAEG